MHSKWFRCTKGIWYFIFWGFTIERTFIAILAQKYWLAGVVNGCPYHGLNLSLVGHLEIIYRGTIVVERKYTIVVDIDIVVVDKYIVVISLAAEYVIARSDDLSGIVFICRFWYWARLWCRSSHSRPTRYYIIVNVPILLYTVSAVVAIIVAIVIVVVIAVIVVAIVIPTSSATTSGGVWCRG